MENPVNNIKDQKVRAYFEAVKIGRSTRSYFVQLYCKEIFWQVTRMAYAESEWQYG